LRNGSIYSEPVERFSSDLNFNGEEAELRNIQLTHYASNVTGGAGYSPSSHAFRFNLAGHNFDLARISVLQSARIAVTGRGDFIANGSARWNNQRSMPPFTSTTLPSTRSAPASSPLTRSPRERNCELTGQSQFEQSDVKVDGNVHLRETGRPTCTSASISSSWIQSSKPTCTGL